MISKEISERIRTTIKRGHNKAVTAKELAWRIDALNSSTRREITRMLVEGTLISSNWKTCRVSGKHVKTYNLPVTYVYS